MKKISDLQLYGFIQLYQILRTKFRKYYFDDTSTDDGYFQISSAPAGKRGQGEIVLEVLNPQHDNEIGGKSFDSINVQDEKITIGFFATEVDTFKYRINKKDLDDPKVISEIKKLIGQIAPVRNNLPDQKWVTEVGKWAKKLIKESPIYHKLERARS